MKELATMVGVVENGREPGALPVSTPFIELHGVYLK